MKKGNFLIVDDEIELVDNLIDYLEDLAENIFRAHNGEEALHILLKENIHCVLCDINMPKIPGNELIKLARKEGITAPFIFYTGHGGEALMHELIPYGVYDFINKPNVSVLDNIVKECLDLGMNNNPIQKSESDQQVVCNFTELLKISTL